MTALTQRHAIFDKWKILIDPKDRIDFENDLCSLQTSSYSEGNKKGFENAVNEEIKRERNSTLPLEDPTRGMGKKP